MKVLILCCLAVLVHGQSNDDIKEWSRDIWLSDSNRFADNDCQYDTSGAPLFTNVNEGGFNGPTYSAFIDLLDNYITEIGTAEPECPSCRDEEAHFLDVIMQTQPMQKCHQYLADIGQAPSDVEAFKDNLYSYWFEPYSRSSGPIDSSGFEHVFVGEVRNTEVTGFHSWIQAYLEEKEGNFVYKYIIEECPPDVATYSFDWIVNDATYTKNIGGHWIRSSPEVELAIYTLCYMTRRNQNCYVDLDDGEMLIKNYDYQGTDQLGSAYPQCP